MLLVNKVFEPMAVFPDAWYDCDAPLPLLKSAESPTATRLFWSLELNSAEVPIATFEKPLLFLERDLKPIAVFELPVVVGSSALKPNEVLFVIVSR